MSFAPEYLANRLDEILLDPKPPGLVVGPVVAVATFMLRP
jgi:hypothetical protein